MSKTVKYAESNVDRIEWVLFRRRSAGPHASRRASDGSARPRGGRNGARVALRKEMQS